VSTYVDIDLPPDAVLKRTSGVCSVCDDRFVDQLAFEVPAPDRVERTALIEARHVPLPCVPASAFEFLVSAAGFEST
jgi:hypothetical protein